MKNIYLLLLLFIPYTLLAQTLRPITRFHVQDSPYTTYANNFLSGFKQSALNEQEGFLQMPFIGEPLLVYVGEKDSTQFMAYASGFQMNTPATTTTANHYEVNYTRYNIRAEIDNQPAYSIQRITYPDTVADKGFLLDIDNADTGSINEDMDVVFIDKKTIRAYKRSYEANGKALYYVAHFSHPFNKWNVRREVVHLENDQRERRCKVALVFDALKPGDVLTVESAVSALSTDEAYAQLHLAGGKKHFSDPRKPRPKDAPTPLLAQDMPNKKNSTVPAPTSASTKKTDDTKTTTQSVTTTTSTRPIEQTSKDYTPLPWLEVATRDAQMRTAFAAVLSQLKQDVPNIKRASNALEFIDILASLYQESTPSSYTLATINNSTNKDNKEDVSPREDAVSLQVDTLLQQYTQAIFTGKRLNSQQAAWFLFHSIGLLPNAQATQFQLTRPSFNVVTIQLPHTRRFILHAKNNTTNHPHIQKVSWQHQSISEPYTLLREQFQRGGILEMRMK